MISGTIFRIMLRDLCSIINYMRFFIKYEEHNRTFRGEVGRLCKFAASKEIMAELRFQLCLERENVFQHARNAKCENAKRASEEGRASMMI